MNPFIKKRCDPTYLSWLHMLAACYKEYSASYRKTGARGVKVCERWLGNFEVFLNDMGDRPDGMVLGRKDIDGDYSPENCIWCTRVEMVKKGWQRRNNVTDTIESLARKAGLNPSTVRGRVSHGWSLEEALRLPRGSRKCVAAT